jgi:hypothetical protein
MLSSPFIIAVGAAELPRQAPLEIELIVQVTP